MTTNLTPYFAVLEALVTLLLGWLFWSRRPRESGVFPKLSFIGMLFTSATIVALVAFATYATVFAVRTSVHYELLCEIYKSFALLCVFGLVLGVHGIWGRSALRWAAPVCAIVAAFVWVIGGV